MEDVLGEDHEQYRGQSGLQVSALAVPFAALAAGVRRPFASRGSVVSGLVVVSLFAAWLVAAFLQDGYVADTYDLADAYVWVTNEADGYLGRVNTEVREQDWKSLIGEGVDVRQDGADVFVDGPGGWIRMDPGELEPRPLPFGSAAVEVDASGGTVGVIDRSGAVYTADADKAETLKLPNVPVVAAATTVPDDESEPGASRDTSTVSTPEMPSGSDGDGTGASTAVSGATARFVGGEEARMAVGRRGDAAVLTGKADRLVLLPADDSEPVIAELSDNLDPKEDTRREVALVGSRPVALVGSSLVLPDGHVVEIDSDEPRLQQPGDESDSVLVATSTGLLSVDIDSGEVESVGGTSIEGGSDPVRPVFVAGTVASAWAGAQAHLFWHGTGGEPEMHEVAEVAAHKLTFRVNRNNVWLNDLDTGAAYSIVDSKVVTAAQIPESEKVTTTTEAPDQAPQQQTTTDPSENNPPVAEDDLDYGARPNLPTVIHPLDNDVDPNDDVLTVQLDEGSIEGGSVELVDAGQAVQVTPRNNSGEVTFTYRAFDGHPEGGTSEDAKVKVTVYDSGNREPVLKTDTAGNPRKPSMTVGAGSTGRYDVLVDWIDPDGDPIYLAQATPADQSAVVTARDSGLLTYTDTAAVRAAASVAVVVADAPLIPEVKAARADGSLKVDVKADNSPPVTRNDYVTTAVGVPVDIEPLRNDLDPDGDEMTFELKGVDGDLASMVIDNGDGTVTVTPTRPGSMLFGYEVSAGDLTALGRIRVDAIAPEAEVHLSAGLDLVVLPNVADDRTSERTVDLLANDHADTAEMLVVTGVDGADADPTLAVQLLGHRRLRVMTNSNLTQPRTLTYGLSSGGSRATGTVVVVSSPTMTDLEPVAVDDSARVRSGDVVNIPVLANDFDPEGAPLHLGRDVADRSSSGGTVWASGSTVRYVAPDIPPGSTKELILEYRVFDRPGPDFSGAGEGIGRVTVQVVNPTGANSPPEPELVESRVLAGRRVRIIVPTSGIDPDGDSVQLVGLGRDQGGPSIPELGRIVSVDADGLLYEAFASDSGGTDEFLYEVVDSGGPSGEPARAIGRIRVGVAVDPGSVNRPPQPAPDRYQAAPGTSIKVKPLVNDIDPEGDALGLHPTDPFPGDSGELSPEALVGDLVRLTVPRGSAGGSVLTARYQVRDSADNVAVGEIRVAVRSEPIGIPPVARDDLARLGGDGTSPKPVPVAVLDNDSDPDGDDGALEIDGVSGDQLQVTPSDRVQVIPYRIIDEQGLDGRAVVRVPPAGKAVDRPPVWNPRGKCAVEFESNLAVSGQDSKSLGIQIPGAAGPVAVDLAQCGVEDPEGKPVRLVDGTSLGASRRLSVNAAADLTGIALRDPDEGARPYFDVVTIAVTDAPVGQPGMTAVIQIPVSVTSEVNQPPVWQPVRTITVTRDAVEAKVDLADYVRDSDGDRLTFSVAEDDVKHAADQGITAKLDGSVLRLTGSNRSPIGSSVTTLSVAASDGAEGREPVPRSLSIDGAVTTKPLPSLRSVEPVVAEVGKPSRVNVLEGAKDPVDKGLQVTSVSVPGGSGSVLAEDDGASGWLVFTPAIKGRTTAVFEVTDGVGRVVPGRVTFVVPAPPDAPGRPQVSRSGADSVRVSWAAATDNGSPVTGYEITGRATSGGSEVTGSCGTDTMCEVRGLDLGVAYRFTVVAQSNAGSSEPSPPSEPFKIDNCPAAPRNVSLEFDPSQNAPEGGVLFARWDAPESNGGAAVTGYRIEVSPAGVVEAVGPRETQKVLTLGATSNGVPQRLSISAASDCDGNWGKAATAGPATPAGVPDAPTDVLAVKASSGAGGRLELSWNVPARGAQPGDNGSAITRYTISEVNGRVPGQSPKPDQVSSAGSGRVAFRLDVDPEQGNYSFTVVAHNAAGASRPSVPSPPMSDFPPPGPVVGLTAKPSLDGMTGLDGKVKLDFQPPATGAGGVTGYEYSRDGVSWTALGPERFAEGLRNGAEYTIHVRAMSAGNAGSPNSIQLTKANGLTAYGLPLTPKASEVSYDLQSGFVSFGTLVSEDGKPITQKDGLPSQNQDNGRPIIAIEYRFNPGEWQTDLQPWLDHEFGVVGYVWRYVTFGQLSKYETRLVDSVGQRSPISDASRYIPFFSRLENVTVSPTAPGTIQVSFDLVQDPYRGGLQERCAIYIDDVQFGERIECFGPTQATIGGLSPSRHSVVVERMWMGRWDAGPLRSLPIMVDVL